MIGSSERDCTHLVGQSNKACVLLRRVPHACEISSAQRRPPQVRLDRKRAVRIQKACYCKGRQNGQAKESAKSESLSVRVNRRVFE
jgi:hypothetical protein